MGQKGGGLGGVGGGETVIRMYGVKKYQLPIFKKVIRKDTDI